VVLRVERVGTRTGLVSDGRGRRVGNTFKSSTSVGVISDGSINGVGRDDRAPPLVADGVGLTIPAHCGGRPT